MKNLFKWLEVTTAYREARPSKHGEELRWILNREKIINETTGESVSRGIIRHPGICVIVPQLADGRILLMRQYRYPVDTTIWELPAGTLSGREDGHRMIATEAPELCAVRELHEETGYHAGAVRKLGECLAMPGSSDEKIHVFLATALTPDRQSLDIGEVIEEVRPFTHDEIFSMIDDGTIHDAKTLVGLLLHFRRSAESSR
jgi:ADP-ribose pyrophosphatase